MREYLDSVRNHKPTLDHVNWLNQHAAAVRTAVSLPVRMIIFDRRRAILPINTADARAARGIAAELMDLLHARSRFQAGVHSVQRGWLPTHPSRDAGR